MMSNKYEIFSLVVSSIICSCANGSLIQVVRKHQYIYLIWLLPMAVGYTFAAIGALLYALEPRYWSGLAQHGSYPLIVIGLIAGLLLIYGWMRFWLTFLVLVQKEEVQPPTPVIVEREIWPPPPTM